MKLANWIIIGILLCLMFFSNSINADETLHLDPNLSYRDLFVFEDQILIKTEKRNHDERRYINKFIYYETNIPLSIAAGYEEVDIAQNPSAYFCLIRSSSEVVLLKRNKGANQEWNRLFVIKEALQPLYNLAVCGDQVLIISPDFIYHNFRKSNEFDKYSIGNDSRHPIYFWTSSKVYFFDEGIFISNNGHRDITKRLIKLTYHPKENSFSATEILQDSVAEMIRMRNGTIYILAFENGFGYFKNALYRLENQQIETIFAQKGILNLKQNGFDISKVQCFNDRFRWWSRISGMPILSVFLYNDQIYLLVFETGVYQTVIDHRSRLKLVTKIKSWQEYRYPSYKVQDHVRKIFIYNDQLYQIHVLPFIEKNKL